VWERDPAEGEIIEGALLATGDQGFVILADPDGHMIEVQALNAPQLDL